MFCARLTSLRSMYVESRRVADFKTFWSLIVSDRIKSTLSESCLRHVLSAERASETGWLSSSELSSVVDMFMANHCNDRSCANAIGLGRYNASKLQMLQQTGHRSRTSHSGRVNASMARVNSESPAVRKRITEIASRLFVSSVRALVILVVIVRLLLISRRRRDVELYRVVREVRPQPPKVSRYRRGTSPQVRSQTSIYHRQIRRPTTASALIV
jgi:hypothetical protein